MTAVALPSTWTSTCVENNQSIESRRLTHRLNERFVKAMAAYHLIEDDDKILVGLSGGKDSLLLTELLAKRACIQHPRFKVEAIHVRMENIQYQTDTSYLEQFCSALDVPLHVVTTSFEVGNAHSEDLRKQKQPCFLCSWNRRKQLFNLAQELGCNKIALGHHQDDIIHTALMNLTYQAHFATSPIRHTSPQCPSVSVCGRCRSRSYDHSV